MASKSQTNSTLLTIEDVIAKRNSLAELERTLEAYRREFEAMLMFVPEEQRAAVLSDVPTVVPQVKPSAASGTKASKKPQKTKLPATKAHAAIRYPVQRELKSSNARAFASFLIETIKRASTGLTHSSLKNEVARTVHAVRLEDEAKAYHRTLSKLVERNEIVRHGGRIYARSVYDRIAKAGALPVVEEGVSIRENSAASIALSVLKGAPQGLTGPQLKACVANQPGAPKSVNGHGQYIYNVLATLVGSGRVIKDGNIYKAVEMEKPRVNGASFSNASGSAR